MIPASSLTITLWARLRSWVKDAYCETHRGVAGSENGFLGSIVCKDVQNRTECFFAHNFHGIVAIREDSSLNPLPSFEALHGFGPLWSTISQFCAVIRDAMIEVRQDLLVLDFCYQWPKIGMEIHQIPRSYKFRLFQKPFFKLLLSVFRYQNPGNICADLPAKEETRHHGPVDCILQIRMS